VKAMNFSGLKKIYLPIIVSLYNYIASNDFSKYNGDYLDFKAEIRIYI
jgi:hypothetical protein